MDPRLAEERFWRRLRDTLAAVEPDAQQPPPDARAGAVLVLLEQTPEGPSVVLTRRRRDLRSHPGQLSFPGGRIDAGESVEQAAIREAQEEIGLRPGTVEVVGIGHRFYIPPSRFWVVPVVARWISPHETDPNPWEVDEILRVPIAQLLERDRLRHVPLSLRGSSWAWQLEDDVLWGATAIVLALLLDAVIEDWSHGLAPEDLADELSVRPWEDAPSVERAPRLEGDLPEIAEDEVPHVTAAQMRVIDDLLEAAAVPLTSLVEHAGRGVTHAARRLLGGDLTDANVTVLAGPGGNGAGGLAAARLLTAAGARVTVLLTGEVALPGQLAALEAADVVIETVGDEPIPLERLPGDAVIDAMLGYGAEPPLRGAPERAAAWLRHFAVLVVSLDLPSGMHADDGLRGPSVTADVTVTLAAPKQGLRPRISHPYVGDLYLADIGVPAAVWRSAGLPPIEVFGRGPLVRLTRGPAGSDAGSPDQVT